MPGTNGYLVHRPTYIPSAHYARRRACQAVQGFLCRGARRGISSLLDASRRQRALAMSPLTVIAAKSPAPLVDSARICNLSISQTVFI